MSPLEYSIPVIWALVIGAAVALYVILDGFDLGIGILFPLFKNEEDRDQMMNSVAPFWDGNETWLVLGGAGLWVAFPKAYAVIMPALYLPVIVMLLALVFRGVAFEFRWVAKPRHKKWDIAFAVGSTIAAFCQGLILGGIMQGISIVNGEFAGASFDWLTPFSLLCGVSLVAGYALIGATWLEMKTLGAVGERARAYAAPLLMALLVCILVVSVWTPLAIPRVAERWFQLPNFAYLVPIPVATIALAWGCWHGIKTARHALPFFCAVGLFLLSYLGLVISNAPYLVPPSLTVWDAAAAPASQVFMLIGTVLMLPVILGYTVFVYWVFRGKVKPGEGYH